jgi:site-specific DNA recombinase
MTDSAARAVLYLRVSTKEQAERGGGAEGFSIPAQREAGLRKAQALNAYVVSEFVDAGESARSADRPELQRMLQYLADNRDIAYVIVHKVDRLARSRSDDVTINLAIRQAGATLISCTENIDETPSGMLLHGIMSSIAEFYSRNLATEVAKGMTQKAQAGGTPTLAPLGYVNVRKVVDGREVRTVELDTDDDRAALIRWAFTAYASGKWSYNDLAAELEARGLTQRATAKRAKRPLEAKKIGSILQNTYYVGTVTYKGLSFPGKHEPLVTPEVFAQVQQVMAAHRQSGERAYSNRNYLAGTLFCGHCGSKLMHSVSRGRGGAYAYWFCAGRHTRKNGCRLPYLAAEQVEDVVIRHWRTEQMDTELALQVEAGLIDDLDMHLAASKQKMVRLDRRIEAIQREREKWAEKAMHDLVPDDIARRKQQDLARQLAAAQSNRATMSVADDSYAKAIHVATTLLSLCGEAYERGNDQLRREWNQTWFSAIYITDDDGDPHVASVERTPFFQAVQTVEIEPPKQRAPSTPHRRSRAVTKRDRNTYRVVSYVGGSREPLLVELRGLEPLTL